MSDSEDRTFFKLPRQRNIEENEQSIRKMWSISNCVHRTHTIGKRQKNMMKMDEKPVLADAKHSMK